MDESAAAQDRLYPQHQGRGCPLSTAMGKHAIWAKAWEQRRASDWNNSDNNCYYKPADGIVALLERFGFLTSKILS